MAKHKALILAAGLLFWSGTASAGALRDFCPDRPGLDTPPCTIDAGHAAIEVGLADWTLDRGAGARQDAFTFGDTLLRYGVTGTLEVQLGWQALGYMRQRAAGGAITHDSGIGDITVALRQNLKNPDGSGFSLAIMPFATLPTGDAAFGASDWTAGIILPVSYELPHEFQLAVTGEVDDAADEAGHGHHLAYRGVAGLAAPIAGNLSGTLEFALTRDEEPGQRTTELLAGLSLAWDAKKSLQFDAGANLGLNHRAPDLELYLGVAKRF